MLAKRELVELTILESSGSPSRKTVPFSLHACHLSSARAIVQVFKSVLIILRILYYV